MSVLKRSLYVRNFKRVWEVRIVSDSIRSISWGNIGCGIGNSYHINFDYRRAMYLTRTAFDSPFVVPF